MLISLGDQQVSLEEAICRAMGYKQTEPIHRLLERYYREHERYLEKVQPENDIQLAKATHEFLDYPKVREYESERRDFYDILLQRIKTGRLIANCMGFSSLNVLLMHHIGLPVEIMYTKEHVYTKVLLRPVIYIENTIPGGFDWKRRMGGMSLDLTSYAAFTGSILEFHNIGGGVIGQLIEKHNKTKEWR